MIVTPSFAMPSLQTLLIQSQLGHVLVTIPTARQFHHHSIAESLSVGCGVF